MLEDAVCDGTEEPMDSTLKSGGKRGQDVHGCRGPGSLSLEKHLPESERRWTAQGGSSLLNTRIARDVEAMINIDSDLEQISNIFG